MMWHGCRSAALLVGVLILGGCAASRPHVHVVAPGETLWGIGQRYGVDHHRLACANRIPRPDRLAVGARLAIPNADFVCRRSAAQPAGAAQPARAAQPTRAAKPATLVARERRGVRQGELGAVADAIAREWPVEGGTLTSGFGPRGDRFHEGIDISAPAGTPVRAADRGIVVFSGVMRGYGNMVVVRHPDGHSTVYAHNQRNWVATDARVRRGEVIASVGSTGRTTGANLHFEVWHGDQLIDPQDYLGRSR